MSYLLPYRHLNYARPMNNRHPLNKGLALWLKALPKWAGSSTFPDLTGNHWDGTLVSHTWESGHPSQRTPLVPVFNSYNGSVVTINYNQHATQRTYTWWSYRTGPGGKGGVAFGYIFNKVDTGAHQQIERAGQQTPTNGFNFYRRWSTTDGDFRITPPSTNVWHFFGISYDSSAAANRPTIYLDGIAQAFDTDSAPAGTVVNNTDKYTIGNYPTSLGDGHDGKLDDFRIYNRLLSASEHYQLYVESRKPFSSLLNWSQPVFRYGRPGAPPWGRRTRIMRMSA